MIISIDEDKMKNIAPLFSGWDETLIWSCLQGCMGRAWTDNSDAPSVGQIVIGDLFFFAGDAGSQSAKELLVNIPSDYSRPLAYMTPKDNSWHPLIESVYDGRYKRNTRYFIIQYYAQ